MIRLRALAAAAAAAAGLAAFATPALADYVRIGNVEVGYRADRDTSWNRFGGAMEGLRLVADHSDIYCRSIRVQFGNGQWQNVFSGMLREDRPVNVDLAGDRRRVNRIDFICRSDRFRGGRIYISADVGRYRDEWRRSPGWSATWSHIFNWGDSAAQPPASTSFNPSNWVSMGVQSFEGRSDHEGSLGKWPGRNVDMIALQPLDNDARCIRVVATYGNGQRQDLNVGAYNILRRGGFYRLKLLGNNRNIRRLDLRCEAAGDYSVRIRVYARK